MIKHITSIVLLTGLLASCGQMSTAPSAPTTGTPGTAPSGTMVQVRLGATAPTATQGFTPLGLPKDAPLARLNVTVRDASNNPVYFVDGVYTPNGANNSAASSTIVLDGAHGFSKSLLLPKGEYTFENAGKYEDVLLSYGPAQENGAVLDDQTNTVQLRFHGVIDPMKSRLDFARQTNKVYTNDPVSLKLYAQTAEVNGMSFPLPLSDIFMGNFGPLSLTPLNHNSFYTLADYDSAEFVGPGSARGVDLIARGTVQNPNLNVTAHFQAYVRQGGSDVATLQPIELPAFEHAIEVSSISADVEAPYNVSMQPFTAPAAGQIVSLMGTAMDNNGVAGIDLYEGNNLIGSTDVDASPNAVRTDGMGNWAFDWVARSGTHELTVVARDVAGNESEASQTVTVSAAAPQSDVTVRLTAANGYYVCCQEYTVPAGGDFYFQVDATGYPYNSMYLYMDAMTGPASEFTTTYGFTRETATTPMTNWGSYYGIGIQHTSNTYWMRVTNTTNHNLDVRPFVGAD